ncbi:MAG: thiamine phosphate synthase [Desulfobacteraceae bacterium]|nr:MAG: thiamine phosphate synthase [Desulfobacteraceae bacterium]
MKKIGKLHVLTDVVVQCRFSHAELARRAIAGGADTIQFRQKSGSTRSMIEAGCEIREVCKNAGVIFLVNDRVDVALACGADGVHLGQDDFPIPLARSILGEERIIGGSGGSLEEVLKCQAEGADYVGFGPVYPTSSKADAGPASGIEPLRGLISKVSIPIVAIGGITPENAGGVMSAGAWGVAVISAVCCRENPEGAVREFVRVIFSPAAEGERITRREPHD